MSKLQSTLAASPAAVDQSPEAASQHVLAHDKNMARQFLATLDPKAEQFTFQFFGDGDCRYAEIFNGTLDRVWRKVLELNTLERRIGVFVTISETDLKGRRMSNIVRPRALYVDADTPEQIASCTRAIMAAGITPSMQVNSGRGMHAYWLCPDIPRDQFTVLQKRLIEKLDTDKAVHDLTRVMRLPGTLHLKDERQPRLVQLRLPSSQVKRWRCSELATRFPLSAVQSMPEDNVIPFALPEWVTVNRPAAACANLPDERLSEGIQADLDEVRSAAAAIPPSAIAAEEDWTKFARAFAHEAATYPDEADQLWEILDATSQVAPGFNQEENRRRFERYVREAFSRSKPITISTLFNMASDHGWRPRATSSPTPASTVAPAANPSRAVPVSELPRVPRKRQWLHGTDLIRGAVTVLAAPGGRAKSTWLLACALACASGRNLLGPHVFGGRLRVLCLSTEDGLSELALRLRAAMQHHGLTDADVPGLYTIGADRWALPLLKMDGSRATIDAAGMSALTAELDHIRPDVLIIDPLINVLGGVSTNDNAAAALLMATLARMATERRMAIALAHHASKGSDPKSADSAMGAASFINLARIALSIEPLDTGKAGSIGLPPWEAKNVFRVLGTKQNFSPPSTDDRWFRLVGVTAANAEPPIYMTGDQVAVVEQFQPGLSGPAFPEAMVRDALQAIDSASPALTASKRSTGRYAVPPITEAMKPHRAGHATEMDGKALLEHLMSAGLVAVVDVRVPRCGKGSDLRNGLALTGLGKVTLQQRLPIEPPQAPQSPATMLQDDAGGDAPASPATQGGCGGNAGEP